MFFWKMLIFNMQYTFNNLTSQSVIPENNHILYGFLTEIPERGMGNSDRINCQINCLEKH